MPLILGAAVNALLSADNQRRAEAAWRRYWEEFVDGVEEAEDTHDRTWQIALALIVLWETRLRRRVVARAATVDIQDREAVRRFRRFMRREVDAFSAGLSRDLVGRATVGVLDPAGRRGSVRGVQGRGIREAAAGQAEAWTKAVDAAEKAGVAVVAPAGPDLADVVGVDTPGGKAVGPKVVEGFKLDPKDLKTRGGILEALSRVEKGSRLEFELNKLLALDELREQELARWIGLQKAGARMKAAGEDLEDVLLEADDNPLRNIRYQADRAVESIIGLTSPYSRSGSAADVIAFMLGSDDRRRTSEGWSLHRGHMRLSVAAHVRAIHRRRTVTEALAAGVVHFRLDVPRARLGRISPGGLLGGQLWRVRTLAEWQDVHRKVNEGRNASSAFDSLGLGYGDVSYIVPVPQVMLPAAVRQGEKMRKRWLRTGKKMTRRLEIRRAA